MSSPTTEDLRNFAERVERLCDYIISKAENREGSDLSIIEKLKQDAADFQNVKVDTSDVFLDGLERHMRGFPQS